MSKPRRRGRVSSSYSVRLQRRAVARTPRRWTASPRLLPAAARLSVGLAVTAELAHLGGAFVEWPGSAARGGYHVVAGALLGLVAAAVCCGPGRAWPGAGALVALAGPAAWLGGTLLGAAPYDELPVPAAVGIAATELALAALLFGIWQARRRAAASPTVRP